MKPSGFAMVGIFFLALGSATAQDGQFGGSYEALDAVQQRLIHDWVARFNDVTKQDVEAGPFYDELVRLSTKTTFDAVTHALMTTALSDDAGASLGTALDLVERLETVKGKVKGGAGDQQFRMYVVLRDDAIDTLEKSVEFKRGADNTVFHRGYPINYRQQGGTPSIQVSIARDKRRADIDVDYRSSSFPVALFNGHLSASNSDVRAGNNDDRHNGRWAGLQSWWQGLFGVRLGSSQYDDTVADEAIQIPDQPRIGKQTIDKMMLDFLTAWLIEGNVAQSMAYISEQAYPCVALDQSVELDLGMAPFMLMQGMQAAHRALGQPESLEDVVLGVNLAEPALRLVRQDHHAQFVIYSVPDDIALDFDCSARMELVDDAGRASRRYGNYFGSTFFVDTPAGRGETVALLWKREDGYWKIVSFETEPMASDPMAELYSPPEVAMTRIDVNEGLASAVDSFLTSWFIDKNYDAAFDFLSSRSYACYNLYRGEGVPAASSDAVAARLVRASMERTGEEVGPRTRLDSLLAGTDPSHPLARVMDHPASSSYVLTSVPNAMAEIADCATRGRDSIIPDDIPEDYGSAFGANFRFRTASGETPVFRMLWVQENGAWKILSYDIEEP